MSLQVETFGLVRVHPAEEVSGDALVMETCDDGLFLAIIDALGHGPEAHEVAVLAQEILAKRIGFDVCEILGQLHEGLLGSRGVAAGVAWIPSSSSILHYAGIGNTVIRKFGMTPTRLVSRDGVLGERFRGAKEQSLALESGDVVLLYTDGVRDRFDLEDYPDILHEMPQKITRTVIERFGRDHDDAACIALRLRA